LCVTGEFPAGAALAVAVDERSVEPEISQEATAITTSLWLDQGEHTLAISVAGGPVTLRTVDVRSAPNDPPPSCDRWESSGTGKLLIPRSTTGDWDLTATVLIGFDSPDGHADLLFCAGELAEGGEGDDPTLGIDFLLGYSLQFHHRRVLLARHAYDERPVAQRDAVIGSDMTHAVAISRRGGLVTARVDDLEPLSFGDPWPHPAGRLGLRTRGARIVVRQLKLSAAGESHALRAVGN
ncbi:MAG: hypothetical protein KIT69_21860, partial [Propionibacteriaceae bacterium]|nr:hypothetical protein [Propionibacteriaceae bacterium]